MTKEIYLDNAATTKVLPAVVYDMLPYYTEEFGNPSSLYGFGQNAHKAMENARRRIAHHLCARPQEIYFTSGGTESDNWALKETAFAYADKGKHIITTAAEHHAITHSCAWLERHGFEVTYLDVDEFGMVDPDELTKALRPDTILVSIIFANNEIGTIQPIKKLASITHEHDALFHTDAVQAIANVMIHVADLDIDLLSASAHKFHGPKGVGFLYVKDGIRRNVFMDGGDQERKRRGGTENVPGIMGMAKALDICMEMFDERIELETRLRDLLIDRILGEIPYTRLNGHPTERLPGNANFSFEFIEGESLLFSLEQKGILASSGSACASGSTDPSHVLLAIGLPHEIAHGSLRLSIGEDITTDDINYTVDVVKKVVERLRSMSPLYEDFLSGKVDSQLKKTVDTADST